MRLGFTIVELLVVMAVISLLTSILLPALAMSRETAKAAQCSSNLRQLGFAHAAYGNEYNDSMMFWYLPSESLVYQKYAPVNINAWNVAIRSLMGWGQYGSDRYGINLGVPTAIHCPSETDTDGGLWRYPHYTSGTYNYNQFNTTLPTTAYRAWKQAQVFRPEHKVVLIDGRPNWSTPWNLDNRFNATGKIGRAHV